MNRMTTTFVIAIVLIFTQFTFSEGVTIITHGYSDNISNWIDEMQEAIWFRYPADLDITVYPIYVKENGPFADTVTVGNRTGTAPVESNSSEIIILLDWSESNAIIAADDNTKVVDAIIPKLFDSSFIPEFGKPLAELPFHLIGHSRGGSLVCGIAKALGENGISVDHVTTLDPHPVFDDEDPDIYSNVLFADNYFQQVEFPQGELITGAYNREFGVLWGGYNDLLPGANHSDTHLWYHGTIDLDTPTTVDSQTIDSTMREQWWRASEDRGAKAGYYYSRIIGGDRNDYPAIVGLNEEYGGYGTRFPINLSSASWPSIYIFNIEEDGYAIKYDKSIIIGKSLDFKVAFYDPDSSFTVYYYFDADRNPYNNNNIFTIGNKPSFSQSIMADTYTWNTSSVVAGTIGYICAEINDGTHKRFFYSPNKISFYEPISTAYTYVGTYLCQGLDSEEELINPSLGLIYPDDYPNMYVIAQLRDTWTMCRIDEHASHSLSIEMWIYDPEGALFAHNRWHLGLKFPPEYYSLMNFGFYLPGYGNIGERAGRWTYRTTVTECNGIGIDDNGYFYIYNNNPPEKATDPKPANNDFSNHADTVLSWSEVEEADSYLIYFGTDPTPDTGEFVAEQYCTTYDPGVIEPDIKYYWKVDTRNTYGTTLGDIWSFQAVSNINPDITGEGEINIHDFSSIANEWLQINCMKLNNWCNSVDIDYSGSVNNDDLLILAEHWLEGSTIIPSDMVFISGGTFQMGDSLDGIASSLPGHSVTLSSFYMGKYEITNSQYCDFLNSALSQGLISVSSNIVYKAGSGTSYPYCDTYQSSTYSQIDWNGSTFSVRSKSGRTMINDPMVKVNWYGAVAYCNWRSQQAGKQACYNLTTWERDTSKKGYHLPTEAQWEYAARGGLSGKRFPWGDTITHNQANYYSSGSSDYDISSTRGFHPTWNDGIHPNTSPVGSFAANEFGLSDMASNVWEWCNDWYGSYNSGPQTNPTGLATGTYRVLRGGSWNNIADYCRVATRNNNNPMIRDFNNGFRISLDY